MQISTLAAVFAITAGKRDGCAEEKRSAGTSSMTTELDSLQLQKARESLDNDFVHS